LGFGALVVGPNPTTPKPQSPIPNPQFTSKVVLEKVSNKFKIIKRL